MQPELVEPTAALDQQDRWSAWNRQVMAGSRGGDDTETGRSDPPPHDGGHEEVVDRLPLLGEAAASHAKIATICADRAEVIRHGQIQTAARPQHTGQLA